VEHNLKKKLALVNFKAFHVPKCYVIESLCRQKILRRCEKLWRAILRWCTHYWKILILCFKCDCYLDFCKCYAFAQLFFLPQEISKLCSKPTLKFLAWFLQMAKCFFKTSTDTSEAEDRVRWAGGICGPLAGTAGITYAFSPNQLIGLYTMIV
jgi:hypothetical protein